MSRLAPRSLASFLPLCLWPFVVASRLQRCWHVPCSRGGGAGRGGSYYARACVTSTAVSQRFGRTCVTSAAPADLPTGALGQAGPKATRGVTRARGTHWLSRGAPSGHLYLLTRAPSHLATLGATTVSMLLLLLLHNWRSAWYFVAGDKVFCRARRIVASVMFQNQQSDLPISCHIVARVVVIHVLLYK